LASVGKVEIARSGSARGIQGKYSHIWFLVSSWLFETQPINKSAYGFASFLGFGECLHSIIENPHKKPSPR